jgi:hypothetical protein
MDNMEPIGPPEKFGDRYLEDCLLTLLGTDGFKVWDDLFCKEAQDDIYYTAIRGDIQYSADLNSVTKDKNREKVSESDIVDTGHFIHMLHSLVEERGVLQTRRVCSEASMAEYVIDTLFARIIPDYTDGYEIHRAKINITTRWPKEYEGKHYPPHYDDEECENLVIIYYIDNSDGDTILFNDDGTKRAKIAPQKGRLLLFHGGLLHAGQGPINHNRRTVLNINFSSKPFSLGKWDKRRTY